MNDSPSDDRVVHDWLVWLVLEVVVPARPEFWERPRIHLVELLFSWSDLYTSFDTVCGERSSTVDVPLIKDLLLDSRITSDKVIKRLDMWLGTESGEGKVVILEVETNTG